MGRVPGCGHPAGTRWGPRSPERIATTPRRAGRGGTADPGRGGRGVSGGRAALDRPGDASARLERFPEMLGMPAPLSGDEPHLDDGDRRAPRPDHGAARSPSVAAVAASVRYKTAAGKGTYAIRPANSCAAATPSNAAVRGPGATTLATGLDVHGRRAGKPRGSTQVERARASGPGAAADIAGATRGRRVRAPAADRRSPGATCFAVPASAARPCGCSMPGPRRAGVRPSTTGFAGVGHRKEAACPRRRSGEWSDGAGV